MVCIGFASHLKRKNQMYNKEGLVSRFADAGLRLEFGEVIRTNEDVFGMKVDRNLKRNTRNEWFVMQPGHQDNTIQVMDTNKKFGQVLLMVKEEAREFTTLEWNSKTKKMDREVKHKTPKSVRKFLLGLDERQLFMAQVNSKATTVLQAHEMLKNPIVHTAEGKVGRAIRQGEWFFLPCTSLEIAELEKSIKKMLLVVKKNQRIGNLGGKPHIAEELVDKSAPRLQYGFPIRSRADIYVRGKIKHPDHETVELKQWRRVLKNMEEGREISGSSGARVNLGQWID